MLLSTRRSSVLAIAIFFFLVIGYVKDIPLSWLRGQQPTKYTPAPKPNDGRFHWENLRQHFPPPSITKLPKPSSRLAKVQHHFGTPPLVGSPDIAQRQQAVKQVLQRCWRSYRERAWLSDELEPISGSSKNNYGGWAATLVDTLDTLWIMDLKDEFYEATEALLKIDFTESSQGVINVFETTIRYLGGFIAAYDLSGDTRILDKAIEVAEMLYAAFDTPNRMPILRWDVGQAARGERQFAHEHVLVAEIGSLSLEFTRLSQITGDNKYYDAIERVMKVFELQQDHTSIPGLWPLVVNAEKQDFASGTHFTLGAMADSLFEYLPKMSALLGGSATYDLLYLNAAIAAIDYNLFRPMTPDNADILISGAAHADVTTSLAAPRLEAQGQHLVCFAGGMFALGGRLLGIEEHVTVGRKITDGCIWTYEALPLGIMPETFEMLPCNSTTDCDWNEALWHEDVIKRSGHGDGLTATEIIKKERLPTGFSAIKDRRYALRPEAIESLFVLYRITGDVLLLDKAWAMFIAINKHTTTAFANAAIVDVTDSSAPKYDSMESFWTAETLKYFFLIFSDPSLISLDDYVLNTEAHPFRRPS